MGSRKTITGIILSIILFLVFLSFAKPLAEPPSIHIGIPGNFSRFLWDFRALDLLVVGILAFISVVGAIALTSNSVNRRSQDDD